MSRQEAFEGAIALAVWDLGEAVEAPDAEATWAALEARLREEPAGSNVRRLEPPRRPDVGQRVARYLVAAAAVVVALATISMRAMPGSPLYPLRRGLEQTALAFSSNDGALHARLASARLGDLLDALENGPARDSSGLAAALVEERAQMLAFGFDVGSLDERIAGEVPPALAGVPDAISAEVRAILGSLLPPEGPGGSAGPGGSSENGLPAAPGQHDGSSGSGDPQGEQSGSGGDQSSDPAGSPGSGKGGGEGSDPAEPTPTEAPSPEESPAESPPPEPTSTESPPV